MRSQFARVLGLGAVATILCGCQKQSPGAAHPGDRTRALEESLAVDVSSLKSADGQPLIILDDSPLNPPPRPEDPSQLPEEDPLHWYDMEYAGWQGQKVNLPKSPGDGARDKYVICLRHMDHPYTTAYSRGMKRVADAHGIRLKTLAADWFNGKELTQPVHYLPKRIITRDNVGQYLPAQW